MKINIRNISEDFFSYFEKSKGLAFEDKVNLWKKLYEDPNRDIFNSILELAHIFDKEYKLEDRYEYALNNYEKSYEKIVSINKNINSNIYNIISGCNDLFEIKNNEISNLNFIVLIGLFLADGWNKQFYNEPTTFFAMECMSKELENVNVFLTHEITHSFHTKLVQFDKNENLAESLFTEGLAVAVSEKIIPGFDDSRYLCVGSKSDKDWLDKCTAAFTSLKEEIKKNFSSGDDCTALYFGQGNEVIPMRAGYVYGYYMIKDFLKKYSFSELIRWDKYRISDEVKKYYDEI